MRWTMENPVEDLIHSRKEAQSVQALIAKLQPEDLAKIAPGDSDSNGLTSDLVFKIEGKNVTLMGAKIYDEQGNWAQEEDFDEEAIARYWENTDHLALAIAEANER